MYNAHQCLPVVRSDHERANAQLVLGATHTSQAPARSGLPAVARIGARCSRCEHKSSRFARPITTYTNNL